MVWQTQIPRTTDNWEESISALCVDDGGTHIKGNRAAVLMLDLCIRKPSGR